MGFERAAELTKKAKQHTENMKLYSTEIRENSEKSVIYTISVPKENMVNLDKKVPIFEVDNRDSVSSIFHQSKSSRDIMVLNFASYNHPGGGFIRGAMAQEEALCHASYLYNVLEKHSEYYNWNNMNKNRGLYKNRAMVSNIRFFDGDNSLFVKVLTCAAPNKSLMFKYDNFTEAENSKVLKGRIKFIADIVNIHKPEIIILGAFGCGVFMNNPVEVSEFFKEAFSETTARKVVFSIPDLKNRKPFENTFA